MLHPDRSTPLEAQKQLYWAEVAFKRVPSLFYVPMTWSDDEVARWEATSPYDQLVSLTSRYGMVPRGMSVLPIDVEISVDSTQAPILNALKTGTATVLISPSAYVGPTLAMRNACDPLDSEKLQYYASTGWSAFEQWRQRDGMEGVVRELSALYRSDDCQLAFFAALQRNLIVANMHAATRGQAYYRSEYGDDEVWHRGHA